MSWHDPDKEDITIYKAVVNHEEQYSIWPECKEITLGWKDPLRQYPLRHFPQIVCGQDSFATSSLE